MFILGTLSSSLPDKELRINIIITQSIINSLYFKGVIKNINLQIQIQFVQKVL